MFSLSTFLSFQELSKIFFSRISKRSGQIDKFLEICLSTSQFSSEIIISIFHSIKFCVIICKDILYSLKNISFEENNLGKHIFIDFLLHRMNGIEQVLYFQDQCLFSPKFRQHFFAGDNIQL